MELLYTKEQFWKLYETLPKEIQNTLWSEEVGENIYEICVKNGVKKLHAEILHLCVAVLIGLLLPQEFEKELQKRLRIKKDVAQKIARQINRFIFYSVKPELEQLYRIEIVELQDGQNINKSQMVKRQTTPQRKLINKKSNMLATAEGRESEETDLYREPLE